jgi:hypothetical protein
MGIHDKGLDKRPPDRQGALTPMNDDPEQLPTSGMTPLETGDDEGHDGHDG